MAQFGLGNFLYELDVTDGSANFRFIDPDDASNVAEVSVPQSEFPEGQKATSRDVADLAYAQCAKVLNDKRDARLQKEAVDDLKEKQAEDRRQREEAADFFNHSQDLADTTPTGGQTKREADKPAPAHKPQVQDTTPDDSKGDKKKK
jgi:hypothetical protein